MGRLPGGTIVVDPADDGRAAGRRSPECLARVEEPLHGAGVEKRLAALAAYVGADANHGHVVALAHEFLHVSVRLDGSTAPRTGLRSRHGLTLRRKSGDHFAGSGLYTVTSIACVDAAS